MATRVPIADLASLAELASAAAKRFGDNPALVRATAVGGAGLSYRALDDLVARGAGALSELTPGSRVLLAVDPSPEWAAALFAILRAGLVAVPVAPSVDQGALRTIVSFTTPAAAVFSDRTKSLSGLLGAVPPVVLSDWPDLFPATGVKTRRDDLALLAFTSGSTDRPRAVELTHGNLLANLASLLAVRTVGPGDALLSMLPPSHLFELMAGLFAPLACGARVVYPGSPLPNRLVDSICDDGITHALAVPALVPLLYGEMTTRDEGPSRLKTLMVGAAALSSEWNARLAALGISLDVGYGLTEAAPIVNVATAGECPDGSVGRALPGVDLRVEDGEVLVRGENVMRGYFRDPEATGRTLVDGWLRTGDRGVIDPEGNLTITGRLKEAIVTSAGTTIYPEEAEPFYRSPLFAEAAVAALTGTDGNDLPVLFVTAADGVGEDELEKAFTSLRAAAPVRLRLARLVRRREPLPRTATGKVMRHLLTGEEGRDE